MSVSPCKNTILEFDPITESVIEDLENVEDFDERWQLMHPGKPSTYGYAGMHVLIEAVRCGKVAFISFLCEKEKALLNFGDRRGWTALSHAAYKNQIEAAEALLELGADPNISSIQFKIFCNPNYYPRLKEIYKKGTTCLNIALSKEDRIDMAVLLLKFNAQTGVVNDFAKQNLVIAKAKLGQERQEKVEQIDSATRSVKKAIPLTVLQMLVEYV